MVFWSIIFLVKRWRDWMDSGKINPLSKKDPELRKDVKVNFTVTDHSDTINSVIGLLTTRQLKMKKIMAWVKLNIKSVKMVQMKSFREEIRVLSAN